MGGRPGQPKTGGGKAGTRNKATVALPCNSAGRLAICSTCRETATAYRKFNLLEAAGALLKSLIPLKFARLNLRL